MFSLVVGTLAISYTTDHTSSPCSLPTVRGVMLSHLDTISCMAQVIL